jgi:hypothetical protein
VAESQPEITDNNRDTHKMAKYGSYTVRTGTPTIWTRKLVEITGVPDHFLRITSRKAQETALEAGEWNRMQALAR